jgi:hypothetical protein
MESAEDDDWGSDEKDAKAGGGWGDAGARLDVGVSVDTTWKIRRAAVSVLGAFVRAR